LKKSLCSEPVIVYPTSDQSYGLLMNAATSTADKPGGLGAILTQIDKKEFFMLFHMHKDNLSLTRKITHPILWRSKRLCGEWTIWLHWSQTTWSSESHPHQDAQQTSNSNDGFFFKFQYKKGIEMPADFLSRATAYEINPFNKDLPTLQRQCSQSKMIIEQIYKVLINPTQWIKDLADTCFIDQSVLWKRVSAQDSWDAQPRTVLFFPTKLRQQLICEANAKLLTGHNIIQKTKERLLTSCIWQNMDFDISNHIKSYLQWQTKDKMMKKASPLQSLPNCSAQNHRVHLDLFGDVKSSYNKNNYILCMTGSTDVFLQH
jgi:hypothetical protein